MSIQIIDPILSEEIASKVKTSSKSKVARYLTKDLKDLLAQPEPIKEYAEMKEKISKLKKKSNHAELYKLRLIEEQKIKKDLKINEKNSSLNHKSYFDPLSFLNECGVTTSSSLSENKKGYILPKPMETPNESLSHSKSVFPFEKVQTTVKPVNRGGKQTKWSADKNLAKPIESKGREIQAKCPESVELKAAGSGEKEIYDWESDSIINRKKQIEGDEENYKKNHVDNKMRQAYSDRSSYSELRPARKSEGRRCDLNKKSYINRAEQINENKYNLRERSIDNRDRYREVRNINKSYSERDSYEDRKDSWQHDKRRFQNESNTSRSYKNFSSNKFSNFNSDSKNLSSGLCHSKTEMRREDRNYNYDKYPAKFNETLPSQSNGYYMNEKNYSKNYETKPSHHSDYRLRETELKTKNSATLSSSEKLSDPNGCYGNNKRYSNICEGFVDLKNKKNSSEKQEIKTKDSEISPRKSIIYQVQPLNSIQKPCLNSKPKSKILDNFLKTTKNISNHSQNNSQDLKNTTSKNFNHFDQDLESELSLSSEESEFSFNPNSKYSKMQETEPLKTGKSKDIEENSQIRFDNFPIKRKLDDGEDFCEKRKKIGEGTSKDLDCSKVIHRLEDEKKEIRGSIGKKQDYLRDSSKKNYGKRRHSRGKRRSSGRRDSDNKRENVDNFRKDQSEWPRVDEKDEAKTRWTKEINGKGNGSYCIHN